MRSLSLPKDQRNSLLKLSHPLRKRLWGCLRSGAGEQPVKDRADELIYQS
ncbi:MAG: hypothetical protein HC780_21095 [Leptolyngbyaceae cyanobacterium CSU_1_3]|nr:hypothetical protein [Leptolyngbyaceae cyanobacterium CSU_1_3]